MPEFLLRTGYGFRTGFFPGGTGMQFHPLSQMLYALQGFHAFPQCLGRIQSQLTHVGETNMYMNM
jgi:hypothetical protein